MIDKLQQWKTESENLSKQYQDRWVKNMKLTKGVFGDEELSRSRTRKRSKIFFRKIWATTWRILASFHTAFLKDRDNFSIEGRDTLEDPSKARVLHKMVEYRRDWLMRKKSLFLKFMWGFRNILDYGWTVGLLSWEYTENKDNPEFKIYPNEQVFPDFSAETKDDMRYIILLDYMNKEEMEELGYKDIDKASPVGAESNELKAVRHMNTSDPLQNPGENEYPRAGSYQDEQRDMPNKKYRVYKTFYREKGRIKYCVSDMDRVLFVDPKDSPYGDVYPIVMGTCLTEPNKLVGEGFPESMEGPQESYNANLNQRKDNVALILNGMSFVSRYGGVDLQSLVNSRPGGVVMMDDTSAVKERDIPDVTQSAYIEASSDDGMMQELAGVTAQHLGLGRNEKATVAQINQYEGNAKIDLYISIVGETFVRDFYTLLAYLIQRFETDEKVFRVANEQLVREGYQGEEIYDIDFEADCIVNVGLGTVSRQQEIQTTMLAMDRAIMSNQAAITLIQMGAVPQDGLKIIDTTAFMEDILPKLGKKDLQRYFIQVPPVQQQGTQSPSLAGMGQPQTGEMPIQNELQSGGLGGF